MRRVLSAVIAAALAAAAGCDWLDDRLRSCSNANVDLANSVQNEAAIHVLGPVEAASEATLLQPGQSRRTTQCLSKGDKRRYRAVGGADVVETIECVASRSSYEGTTLRVTWTRSGFRCEGW